MTPQFRTFRRTPLLGAFAVAMVAAGAAIAQDGAASIAGRVLDGSGQPVANARVFVEEGLTGTLESAQADGNGRYAIGGIRPGNVGVFAFGQGHAFGGASADLAYGASLTEFDLALGEPQRVTGAVVDTEDKPVQGARITRAALLGSTKVSIPFGKLHRYGFDVPITNTEGRYTVPHMPRHTRIDLKVTHGQFAQRTAENAGSTDEPLKLYPGVMVSGSVLSRGGKLPVSNALLVFRNAANRSVLTQTSGDGKFNVRLNPGPYYYRAEGPTVRSGGWQRFTIPEQAFNKNLTLYVAESGGIRGEVRDAVNDSPIEGARLTLESFGSPSSRISTGPDGAFEFPAPAGENTVKLDVAPGYKSPPSSSVTVDVKAGEVFELPTFWLAPIPAYSLQVVGPDEQPVPDALIQIRRPPQLGWHVTNEEGRVELSVASLPNDGTIVGTVEDPSGTLGALFALKREDAQDAVVQLLELGAVHGRVVDDSGDGLPGAIVAARYTDENMTTSVDLWRTVSGPEGRFEWNHVVPYVPQQLGATVVGQEGASPTRTDETSFVLSSPGPKDVGTLSAPEGAGWLSLAGKRFPMGDLRRHCGPAYNAGAPAVVIVVDSGNAAPWLDVLNQLATRLPEVDLHAVAVSDSPIECPSNEVTVLVGDLLGPATTYLVDASGTIALETFGLPPVGAMRALTEPE